MSRFHPDQTVASVVTASPGTSRVFERYGIDYCCGGHVALAAACARKGVEADVVLSELDAAAAQRADEGDASWSNASALVDYILEVHHSFVHRELPRLSALMAKVERVHGPSHPEQIPAMARIWARVAAELAQHMAKEEQVLFPMIRALEAGRAPDVGCGIEGPLFVMEAEHEQAGHALAEMRALAQDYAVPEGACGSWRALWSGLDEFEKDLHVHVHLENNVLFPRVRGLAGIPA
jgi:regulator of cell morphogenesis and NO signaling